MKPSRQQVPDQYPWLGLVEYGAHGEGGSVMDRSGSHFGLTDLQWDQAKEEVREAIMDAAYDRRMTWYGEVASKVTVVPLDPYSSLMNHLLGAVFEDEYAGGRPALTSIVTHKHGDKEPGGGFY